MDNHNKCWGDINGNMKIVMNMVAEFGMPKDLEDVVYISQLFQGETIRCAVEHLRRNRGRCMGATYWQVNDNYPVASWSSIDYYGRWKALHYMVKRFFAPVLLTAYEDGLIGHIHVVNETLEAFEGTVLYQVRHVLHGILSTGSNQAAIDGLSASQIVSVDVSDYIDKPSDERYIYI